MLPEVKPETAVYPRWRGEHGFPFTDEIECDGLSPLARGTLITFILCKKYWRFIPAGAGNTLKTVMGERYRAVYPRWRGEHLRLDSEQAIRVGLSPLARGTRRYAGSPSL